MKRSLTAALFLFFAASTCYAQQGPPMGVPLYGSFGSFGVGSVNLQDLNFNYTIPVMSSSGRALKLGFIISYNSSIWSPQGSWMPAVDPGGNPTWGWNLSAVTGAIPYQYTTGQCFIPIGHGQWGTTYSYDNYQYVEPNGTHHKFNVYYDYTQSNCVDGGVDSLTTGYATDNSGFFINIANHTSPVVYAPDGSKITAGSITDTNGNKITATVVNGSETDWTDSSGRIVLKIIKGSSNIQYEVLDQNGQYQTVTVTLSSKTIKTNFACQGVTEYTGTAQLVTGISFPDGTGYGFTYEGTPGYSNYVTGRIYVVSVSAGAGTQYNLYYSPIGGPQDPHDGVNCSDGSGTYIQTINTGGPSGDWTFAREQNGGNWQTTVSAPDPYTSPYQDQTLYNFNSAGQETSRLMYQGNAGGTLLREIDTAWASNGTPQSRTLVLEDANTAAETETTFDSYGNLLTLKEHDWGTKTAPGPILRTTNNTYLSTSAYTSRNIMDRLVTKTVADLNGTVQYREDISFDDAGSINTPCVTGAAQHDDTNYGCSFTVRGSPTTVTTYTDPAHQAGGVSKSFTYDSLGNLRTATLNCCQQKQWNY
jgi:hypothetical protein